MAVALEPDQAVRTVCVHGVQGMPEFHLQLLFETERTGGGDLESVRVSPDGDSALITFIDPAVARRVLDRKQVSMDGRVLTITEPAPAVKYDPQSIIVSNIPPTMDSFMLEIYFENEKRSGGGNIVKIEREAGSNAACITFEETDVAKRVLTRNSGLKLPDGTTLDVRACPLTTAVQVQDVYERDRAILELYFESPRSGGRDVKDVTITGSVGIVTFKDPEVVPQVLHRQHSFGDSRQLTIRPYNPELHKLPDTTSNVPNVPEAGTSKVRSGRDSVDAIAKSVDRGDKSLKIPLKMSGILGFLKDTKNGSSWLSERSTQCNYDIDWNRSIQDEICITYSPGHSDGSLPTDDWFYSCRQEFDDLSLDVSERKVKVESALFDAVERKIEKDRRGESTVFCQLEKSTGTLTLTGFERDVIQCKEQFKRILQGSDDVLENEVSLEAGIIHLLHLTKHIEYMKDQDADLDVSIRNDVIVLKGTEEHLHRGYNLLYDNFISNIIQEEFKMIDSKFSLLASPSILHIVETEVTEEKLVASIDVDTKRASVIVYALTQQDVTHIKDLVHGIVEKKVDKRGVTQQRWDDIKSELMRTLSDHLTIEDSSTGGHARVICTLKVVDSVNIALQDLEDAQMDEQVVPVAIPTAVLVQSHFLERLTSITEDLSQAFPDVETSITACDPKELPGFLIKGSQASIEEAANQLRNLLSGVLRRDHDIKTPTMPQYFLTSESRDFIADLEHGNKVVCVVDDDDDRLLHRQAPESPRESRPKSPLVGATAAPFPASLSLSLATGQTISVLAEDLTRCELDALVVPATNVLEHTQPTVVHLTEHGGSSIREACREQRKVFTRDLLLGTTCRTEAGQNKCGHLIHMVTTRGDLLQTDDSFISACIGGSLEDIKYLGLESAAVFICENKPKVHGDLPMKLQNLAMAVIDFLAFDTEHKVRTLHLVVMDHRVQRQLYQAIEQLCNNFGISVTGQTKSSDETEGAVGGASEAEPGAVGGASDQTFSDEPSPADGYPERVTVSVYGMCDNNSVDKAIDLIQHKCFELCDSQMVASPEEQDQISKLSPSQVQSIQDLADKYHPWIVLELKKEDHLNYVEVCGRQSQVAECVRQVRAIISTPESSTSASGASGPDTRVTMATDGGESEGEAVVEGAVGGLSPPVLHQGDDILAGSMEMQEQFHWERRLSSGNYDKFPRDISALLEIAYKDAQPTAEFEDYNGLRYSVDFHAMKQLPLSSGGKNTSVRRKGEQKGPGTVPTLPVSWTPMGSQNLISVALEKNDQEYEDVEEAFRATCPNYTIKKIERIQNPGLYRQYQIKLQLLEASNDPGTENQRRLYHGTSVETVPNINRNGFNRSYCGKNATMYGSGVYFAREAAYSARRQYSPETDGNRYMYQCLVATGTFTQGNQAFREPPPKDPSNPTDRYDSVVDRVTSPDMFVIFHDTQAYPEYLITFI